MNERFESQYCFNFRFIFYVIFNLILGLSFITLLKRYWISNDLILLLLEITVLLTFILFIWTWLNTSYVINNDKLLIIINGPLKIKIPIQQIKVLLITNDSAIGLFFSLKQSKRIKIIYKNTSTIVYPKNIDCFVDTLVQANSKIVVVEGF